MIGKFLLLFSLFNHINSAEAQLTLSLNETPVSCRYRNFRINFLLCNTTQTQIKLPKPLVLLNDLTFGDGEYNVEKFDQKGKTWVPYRIDRDHGPIRSDLKFDTLYLGDKLIRSFGLECGFYHSGIYRVRLKLFISKYNHGVEDFISNWISFEVIHALELEN